MSGTRDDFKENIKDLLKQRAAYICSNPSCKKLTIGPSKEDDKIQYFGVVAHITAASKLGPRYDNDLTSDERKSSYNGIFLCNSCSTLIDKNDGIDFSVDSLQSWKKDHEKWVKNNLNKSVEGDGSGNVINNGDVRSQKITINNYKNLEDNKVSNFRVSFNEFEEIITLNPILERKIVKYIYKEWSLELANEKLEKAKSNLSGLQNSLNKAMAPAMAVQHIFREQNLVSKSWVTIEVILENIGEKVIEDWKFSMKFKNGVSRMSSGGEFNRFPMVNLNFDNPLYVDEENLTLNYNHKSSLVQKDNKSFDISVLTEINAFEIQLEWELIARDYNKKGTITLPISPDYIDIIEEEEVYDRSEEKEVVSKISYHIVDRREE